MQKFSDDTGTYWIDKNKNTWNCEFYTEAQAKKNSLSLLDCHNCKDCACCAFCKDCIHCNNMYKCKCCEFCENCTTCNNCQFCRKCTRCKESSHLDHCQYSNNCLFCSECSYCDDCTNCCNCKYCFDDEECNDCDNSGKAKEYSHNKKRPQIYVTGEIGSRHKTTCFYWTSEKDMRITCGCFMGNLDEFERAVLETHEHNEVFRNQYLDEIKKVRELLKQDKENKEED